VSKICSVGYIVVHTDVKIMACFFKYLSKFFLIEKVIALQNRLGFLAHSVY